MNTTPTFHTADQQAVVEVACPSCSAKPNAHCVRPDGVRYPRTHVQRIITYRNKIGGEEFTKRHSTQIVNLRRFNPEFRIPVE